MKYDIFISYRRKDCAGLTSGTNIARTIKQQLEIEGYKNRVFFDYSELSDDDFEKIILKAIEGCKVFVLVLSRDSMMRCVDDEDWVRREICHAQANGLKIIPVEPDNLFNGYPENFPAELEVVKRIQHTTIHMDSSFERDMRAMIDARIRPILTEGDAESVRGALVKINTDLECRVLDFGEVIATIGRGYSEIRLPKGNHEISFVGIESDEDRFDCDKLNDIRDTEYVYNINVTLRDKYNARKAEERRQEEERRRREEERKRHEVEAKRRAEDERIRQEEEQKLREQRMKEEAIKAAIRKKRRLIAGLLLLVIIGCYVSIRHYQEKKAEQVRIAEQKRIAAEKAVQDSIALQKRIIAERAENKRKAEQKRKAEERRIAAEKAKLGGKGIEGIYKVGYYYDDGKKQGVVFEVSSDGKHGKIVSLTEVRYMWAAKNWQIGWIGASDKHNGANNMAKVKQIADWRYKFPAFRWCADLGEGWYIPAIEELEKFTIDDAVYDAVNRTLAAKGKELANKGESHCYWSSTEAGEFCAWGVRVGNGVANYSDKNFNGYVRAVSAF